MTVDIAKLRALLEAATSRPWWSGAVETTTVFVPEPDAIGGMERVLCRLNVYEPYKQTAPTDAALIAAAVNALPELLDEVERKCQFQPCPCLHTTPCHKTCSCIHMTSSSGCHRCCTVGNPEQQRVKAEWLVNVLNVYEAACAYRDGPDEDTFKANADKSYELEQALLAAVDRSRT